MVGGAVRDLLLGREPHELDFVVEGDAVAVARRAAERLGGRVTVHERFGTATVERAGSDVRPRGRAPRALRAARGPAGRGARRVAARGPRAARLHGQRDRAAPGRRRARLATRGARRTCAPAGCGCCTTARSATTRRACCGWRATPPGSGSSRSRTPTGWRPQASAEGRSTPSPARGWAPSCGCCCGSRSPAALLALERHGLGARAARRPAFARRRARRSTAIDLTPPGERRAGGARRDAGRGAGTRRPLDRLAFPGPRARHRRRRGAARRTAGTRAERRERDAELWRRFARRRPRRWRSQPPPAEPRAARRWLGDVRHRRLAITATTSSPPGSRARRSARRSTPQRRRCSKAGRPAREEQLAAGLEAAGA